MLMFRDIIFQEKRVENHRKNLLHMDKFINEIFNETVRDLFEKSRPCRQLFDRQFVCEPMQTYLSIRLLDDRLFANHLRFSPTVVVSG